MFVQCKIGWAGDGRMCGPDRDLDSWPDYDLGCADAKCRKVRATLEYSVFRFNQMITPGGHKKF